MVVGAPALPLPLLPLLPLFVAPAWPAGGSAAVEQANKAKHERPVEIRLLVFMVSTSVFRLGLRARWSASVCKLAVEACRAVAMGRVRRHRHSAVKEKTILLE